MAIVIRHCYTFYKFEKHNHLLRITTALLPSLPFNNTLTPDLINPNLTSCITMNLLNPTNYKNILKKILTFTSFNSLLIQEKLKIDTNQLLRLEQRLKIWILLRLAHNVNILLHLSTTWSFASNKHRSST